MQGPLESALVIRYRPSRWIFCVVVALHAGALPVLVPTALPGWLKGVIAALVIAGLVAAATRYRREQFSRQQLRLTPANAWLLEHAGGESEPLALLPGSLLHPDLMILRFRGARGSRPVFVLSVDNVDADTRRRLRVRLRFPRREDSDPGSRRWE